MWFRFPEGVSEISIQQLNFKAEWEEEGEVKDGNTVRKVTWQFFRAPEHLAPYIMDLKDFAAVGQPEGAPDDLAPGDPGSSTTIQSITGQMNSLQEENLRLREVVERLTQEMKVLEARTIAAEAKAKAFEQQAVKK